MYDFDAGSEGSQGPFVSWSAKGTDDGSIDPRSFYMRGQGGEKSDVTEAFKKGVVFDITAMKTGWQQSGGTAGVAPSWRWNQSISRFEAKPGDDWKKGFSLPVAISKSEKAVWEQAGAGAFEAIKRLMAEVSQQAASNKGLLPVVKMVNVEAMKFSVGSTNFPVLQIVRWTAAPACLSGDQMDAGEDDEPAPAPKPAAKAAKQPEPAAADDEEF